MLVKPLEDRDPIYNLIEEGIPIPSRNGRVHSKEIARFTKLLQRMKPLNSLLVAAKEVYYVNQSALKLGLKLVRRTVDEHGKKCTVFGCFLKHPVTSNNKGLVADNPERARISFRAFSFSFSVGPICNFPGPRKKTVEIRRPKTSGGEFFSKRLGSIYKCYD
jgi:hypothetical protein